MEPTWFNFPDFLAGECPGLRERAMPFLGATAREWLGKLTAGP